MDIHGPLQTRGETRYPGGVSVSYLASRTRHKCPRHNDSVYMEAWHYIGSVTVTTNQEKGKITLESNPSNWNNMGQSDEDDHFLSLSVYNDRVCVFTLTWQFDWTLLGHDPWKRDVYTSINGHFSTSSYTCIVTVGNFIQNEHMFLALGFNNGLELSVK